MDAFTSLATVRCSTIELLKQNYKTNTGGRSGIRTHGSFRINSLARSRFRPLSHSSALTLKIKSHVMTSILFTGGRAKLYHIPIPGPHQLLPRCGGCVSSVGTLVKTSVSDGDETHNLDCEWLNSQASIPCGHFLIKLSYDVLI